MTVITTDWYHFERESLESGILLGQKNWIIAANHLTRATTAFQSPNARINPICYSGKLTQ